MTDRPLEGVTSPWPTGGTSLLCVLGNPIRHSLSPLLLNAAIKACGIDAAYVAFEIGQEQAVEAVRAVRTLGINGASVTFPFKERVIPGLDLLTSRARVLNSVNTIYREGTSLVGDSTDGEGLVASLRSDHGVVLEGETVALLGTGGAARAIALALRDAGATVVVVGRNADALERVLSITGSSGRAGGDEEIRRSSVVVNATSVGMYGTQAEGASPVDGELLHEGHFVYDIVYHPLETELLRHARERGARTGDGTGMLLHQAARAFGLWFGRAAPLEKMRTALLKELRERELQGS